MVKLPAAWHTDTTATFNFDEFNDYGSFLRRQRIAFKIKTRNKTRKRTARYVRKVEVDNLRQSLCAEVYKVRERRDMVVRQSLQRVFAFCNLQCIHDPAPNRKRPCFPDLPYWIRNAGTVANSVDLTTAQIHNMFKNGVVTDPTEIKRLGDCYCAQYLHLSLIHI